MFVPVGVSSACTPFGLGLLHVGRPVGHGERRLLPVHHLPALLLGRLLPLPGRIDDARLVGSPDAEMLDRLGVAAPQRAVPAGFDLVGPDVLGVHLEASRVCLVRDDVRGDVAETAAHPDRHGRLVQDEPATDPHEVLLAGLFGGLARVDQGGVTVVHHDRAPVNAPGGVAPRGERAGELEELLVQTWFSRVCPSPRPVSSQGPIRGSPSIPRRSDRAPREVRRSTLRGSPPTGLPASRH